MHRPLELPDHTDIQNPLYDALATSLTLGVHDHFTEQLEEVIDEEVLDMQEYVDALDRFFARHSGMEVATMCSRPEHGYIKIGMDVAALEEGIALSLRELLETYEIDEMFRAMACMLAAEFVAMKPRQGDWLQYPHVTGTYYQLKALLSHPDVYRDETFVDLRDILEEGGYEPSCFA